MTDLCVTNKSSVTRGSSGGTQTRALMENDPPPMVTNTPSKLRPPKPRKSAFADPPVIEGPLSNSSTTPATDREIGQTSAQKRRIESPRSLRTKLTSLPPAIPAPVLNGERVMRTYKSSAATTARPAPVTKPVQRTTSFSKQVTSRDNARILQKAAPPANSHALQEKNVPAATLQAR